MEGFADFHLDGKADLCGAVSGQPGEGGFDDSFLPLAPGFGGGGLCLVAALFFFLRLARPVALAELVFNLLGLELEPSPL
jgi:hypothetical protein